MAGPLMKTLLNWSALIWLAIVLTMGAAWLLVLMALVG